MVGFGYLFVGDVVDDDAAVGASVKRGSDGLEPLLAGGVPNLQGVVLAVVGDVRGQEIGPHGRSVLRGELSGHVSVHQGGLANTSQKLAKELFWGV